MCDDDEDDDEVIIVPLQVTVKTYSCGRAICLIFYRHIFIRVTKSRTDIKLPLLLDVLITKLH